MRDYGSSGDPASELRGLVVTGAVGGALQQYITSTLGAHACGRQGVARREPVLH